MVSNKVYYYIFIIGSGYYKKLQPHSIYVTFAFTDDIVNAYRYVTKEGSLNMIRRSGKTYEDKCCLVEVTYVNMTPNIKKIDVDDTQKLIDKLDIVRKDNILKKAKAKQNKDYAFVERVSNAWEKKKAKLIKEIEGYNEIYQKCAIDVQTEIKSEYYINKRKELYNIDNVGYTLRLKVDVSRVPYDNPECFHLNCYFYGIYKLLSVSKILFDNNIQFNITDSGIFIHPKDNANCFNLFMKLGVNDKQYLKISTRDVNRLFVINGII